MQIGPFLTQTFFSLSTVHRALANGRTERHRSKNGILGFIYGQGEGEREAFKGQEWETLFFHIKSANRLPKM